jgi:hypothetical protein
MLAPRDQFQREQRSHAHADDMERVVLADQFVVGLGHHVHPLLRHHGQQVLGHAAMTGQRHGVRLHARAPQHLVHRPEVVLGTAKP